ncbi:MAG: protein kinase [Actinobacteria bacterium]|nr:protein kinase [Actinomycetota bacterium]
MRDHARRGAGLSTPVISGYRDLVLIAEGGFSSVYTAKQERFDRTVAIKVLHTSVQDAAAQRQFTDECRLTGRLTGEAHIIAVFDAGATEDGHPFLSMQYLPGGSLADRLASSGPLPAGEVVRVGTIIAGALAAAHEANILHRDIKPGNILLSAADEPVLSDFGIARHSHATAPAGAAAMDAFTPAFSAPEVLAGRPSSAASDIYSLGSTLYTLLAGEPPAGGVTAQAELRTRNRIADFPDPEHAGLPAGLVALIRHCLAYEPSQRPGSARQLAADLAAFPGAAERASPSRGPAVSGLPRRSDGAGDGRSADAPGAPIGRPGSHGAPHAPPWAGPTRVPPRQLLRTLTISRPRRNGRLAKIAAGAVAGLAVLAAAGLLIAQVVSGPRPGPSPLPAAPTHSASPVTPSVSSAPGQSAAPIPRAQVSSVHYIHGSAISLNSASGHGCKAWMNGGAPGSYAQGLAQSWGDDCQLDLRQSNDGGRTFSALSGHYVVSSTKENTGFYRNGRGQLAKVCLKDVSASESACGRAFRG